MLKLRKSFWIVPSLLLFAAIGAPSARADDITDYPLVFSLASGPATPSGTLVYDSTDQTITLAITEEGYYEGTDEGTWAYNFTDAQLTAGLNNPPPPTLCSGTGAQLVLEFFQGCLGKPLQWSFYSEAFPEFAPIVFQITDSPGHEYYTIIGESNSRPEDPFCCSGYGFEITTADGTLSVESTTTAVPEPGTVALTLIGLGLLGLMRKRILPTFR